MLSVRLDEGHELRAPGHSRPCLNGTAGSNGAVSGSRCPARATGAGDSRACSGRAAFVSTMEPADFRDRYDDGAVASRHDRPRNRRVFAKRQVRAGLFVVRTLDCHQPHQTRFVEHDHTIETFATDGSNEPVHARKSICSIFQQVSSVKMNADAAKVFGVLSLLGSGTRGERARDGRDVHIKSSAACKRAAA